MSVTTLLMTVASVVIGTEAQSPVRCANNGRSEEARLVHDILLNYDRRIKPTINASTQVTVYVQFALSKVEGLDSETELLSTHGYIIMFWYDQFLHWNPADYCGITQVFVTSEDVWLPEIGVKNSAENGNDISLYTIQKYRISVAANGYVRWVPRMTWVTTCKMFVYYFPYDVQVCHVVFANWMYTASLVNLTLIHNELIMDGFQNHSEWLLVNHSVGEVNEPVNVDGSLFLMPEVYFSLTLARAPSYYVINVLFMSGTLTAVCLIMFSLPVHACDKVILGVTVLLSYAVLLINVNDATPQSEILPLTMIVICVEILLCGSSIIFSTIVLRIHDHPPLNPIPHWANRLLLKKVARWLNITVVKDECEDEDGSHVTASPSNDLSCPSSRPYHIDKQPTIQQLLARVTPTTEGKQVNNQSVNTSHQSQGQHNGAVNNSMEDEIREYFRLRISQFCEEERRRLYEAQWRDFARVLDRVFLIFWSLVFFFIHLILYLILYGYIAPVPNDVEDDI